MSLPFTESSASVWVDSWKVAELILELGPFYEVLTQR
jgi:hypothetical protein